jgi:hypothetical protein
MPQVLSVAEQYVNESPRMMRRNGALTAGVMSGFRTNIGRSNGP